MEMQPSPQGIASLYMGNPGALQKKVQKDQQANPGLPPDLKNLLALNIVTNERDAAKRQQAMNALNQMAPAGQQPPTVAQSLQEQAKQKLQAQMLQQQRQQQGLAALAQQSPSMEIPESTPQPARQPQGIDELPVEMELAGGGIVAFKKGEEVDYETPYDRMNRENREQEARDREAEAARGPLDAQAAEDQKTAANLWRMLKSGNEAAGRAIADIGMLPLRGLAGAYDTAVVRPMRAAGINAAYLAPKLTPDGADVSSMTPFTDVARKREAKVAPFAMVDPGTITTQGPGYKVVPRRPIEVEGAPATDDGRTAAPEKKRTAPPAAAKPATEQPVATPTPAKSMEDVLAERLKLADAQRTAEMDRYAKAIPRPDTSQYDRLVAELEGRRKQFDAPKPGFDAFAELMTQIAAQGPQKSWDQAGAKGAAAQTALDKERKTQQFELTKQMVDVAQKKIDADRAYNKELYATGDSAAKRIDAITKEIAQEAGLDRRKADELANAIKVANIHAAATRYSADKSAAARADGQNPDKQTLNELKALQTSLKDQLATASNKFDAASRAAATEARQKLAAVNAAIAKMAGLGTMDTAPSAEKRPGGVPAEIQMLLNKYGSR